MIPQPKTRLYAGADWLRELKIPMSVFGERAADLIGDWQRGIYHVQCQAVNTDWTGERFIRLIYHGYLSTFDSDDLTRLVILAHDRCIRVQISPCMRYLEIMLHPRDRDGRFSDRHGTIEGAIKRVRTEYAPIAEDA